MIKKFSVLKDECQKNKKYTIKTSGTEEQY